MPNPFQFQPYDNSRTTGTIAELMARRGEIAARGAEASGQAKAAAISNVGQSVAGSLDRYLTERKNAPIRALETQQLQQQVEQGKVQLDASKRAAMAKDVLAIGVQKYGDDAEKVVAFVTKNGFPDVADGYLKTHDLLRGIKEGAIKDQDTANAFEADVLTRISKLATPEEKQSAWTAAQGVLKAHRVDTSSLSPTWNDEQAQQQIALYGPKPKLMSVAPGSTVIDQNNPDGAPLVTAPNPAQQETARHNTEMEKIARMTAGRTEAAQQETARHNRALEAAAAAKAPSKPDVKADARTTISGTTYLDMGDYETPTERQKARDAAREAGVPVVAKDVGDSLRAGDQARLNMTAMLNNILSKLPKDAASRPEAYASATLAKLFQTDEDKAAFASWRSGAIQAAQAMAEKGMGFRLNQAEIALIQSTDQTQLTDTVGTAMKRLNNILTMLNNKEHVALTKDRSTLATQPGQSTPGGPLQVGKYTVTVKP